MASPDRLSVEITTASGAIFRWGGDEPDAANIPRGLSFDTSVPGGFKTCSLTLTRRIDLEWSDLNLLDDVRVYGPGNETVWEGRVSELPRSQGDDFAITVQCVGWNAHLKDDPSFREIYVDRDVSKWGEPSLNRRATALAAGRTFAHYTASVSPGIGFQGESGTAVPSGADAEIVYDAGSGLAVAKAMYVGSQQNTGNVEAATLYTDDNDSLSSASSTGLTLDSTLRTVTPAAAERYAMLRALATGTHTPVSGSAFARTFVQFAVYGNHGLTTRSISSTEPDGIYGSDILADVVSRAAPLLTYTEGADGSIEPTTFPIPHASFPETTTAEEVISRINAYHLYEWGVYDNREFFFRQPDPERCTWQARTDLGLQWELAGDQSDDLYNGVIVQYQDANGQARTAGPPGSGCDDESTALEDTSDTNPVNAHGIPKKWGVLSLSVPTSGGSSGGAVQIGTVWLAEHSLPQRRGSMTLRPRGLTDRPMVAHPTKGYLPISRIRAGDYISVTDANSIQSVPRRIVETRYSHDDRSMALTLDATSQKLEGILERLGVQLTGF